MAFVFADPAFADLMQRHRIEEMQLLASAPDDDDQVRPLKDDQVLRHRLTRHLQVTAEFAERLAIALVQLIQQLSAALIGQRFEDCIHRRRK